MRLVGVLKVIVSSLVWYARATHFTTDDSMEVVAMKSIKSNILRCGKWCQRQPEDLSLLVIMPDLGKSGRHTSTLPETSQDAGRRYILAHESVAFTS